MGFLQYPLSKDIDARVERQAATYRPIAAITWLQNDSAPMVSPCYIIPPHRDRL